MYKSSDILGLTQTSFCHQISYREPNRRREGQWVKDNNRPRSCANKREDVSEILSVLSGEGAHLKLVLKAYQNCTLISLYRLEYHLRAYLYLRYLIA